MTRYTDDDRRAHEALMGDIVAYDCPRVYEQDLTRGPWAKPEPRRLLPYGWWVGLGVVVSLSLAVALAVVVF